MNLTKGQCVCAPKYMNKPNKQAKHTSTHTKSLIRLEFIQQAH